MSRSAQEILDRADALAARFERHEPDEHELRDAAALRLVREAFLHRADAERRLADAVTDARSDDHSWAAIGAMVGTRARPPASVMVNRSRTADRRQPCHIPDARRQTPDARRPNTWSTAARVSSSVPTIGGCRCRGLRWPTGGRGLSELVMTILVTRAGIERDGQRASVDGLTEWNRSKPGRALGRTEGRLAAHGTELAADS